MTQKQPHPVIWLILYIPFGALGGFISVALTFLATQHGISISEGSLIIGSQLLISWLKWLWAPLIDISLTPKKWYVISTIFSAIGVLAMSAVPLGRDTLPLLILIIAIANLVNSIVGMSVEAMIAVITTENQISRASAWFQAGNLGGTGLGGALGLFLIQKLSKPWMSGATLGVIFIACCLALIGLPDVTAHVTEERAVQAAKKVIHGFWKMVRGRSGSMTALMCILPIATGAAQGTLTQSAVAAYWGAGAEQVELVQGLFAGVITAAGCFAGGWLCERMKIRTAYACIAFGLAVTAAAMALSPATVAMYVVWNMIYALGVGLAYAAFTAMVLQAIGNSAAATGYNVFASLSNFPLWWLGLLLGLVADKHGPRNMLFTEAALGVLGVVVFLMVERRSSKKLIS